MHLHGSLIIKHTKFCVNAIFKDLIYANFITKSFQVKSPWFLPFAYVFVADKACGIVEALSCGDTLKAWWNWQRMSVIRTTSYFFGLIENIRRQLGLSKTKFSITAKVVTEDVLKRYEKEVIWKFNYHVYHNSNIGITKPLQLNWGNQKDCSKFGVQCLRPVDHTTYS